MPHGTGDAAIAESVAPDNPYLGVMLPYTPLHHLLLAELGVPVVATSGNLADEPICTGEREALERLSAIADLFLVHDRPIARHVDDSVVRVTAGRELVLRRARGYAPFPVSVVWRGPAVVATGAHLKNAVAVAVGTNVFVIQRIGDLETQEAVAAFERAVGDLCRLYGLSPHAVACDAHPDYLSTQFARSTGLAVIPVQHHEAHLLACMAENGLEGPALGVVWDGTGLGTDRTLWGGEFFRVSGGAACRVGHFRTFRLPGGEKAIEQPRRAAVGVLYELYGSALTAFTDLPPLTSFTSTELRLMLQMLRRRVNAPETSSVGRLFDAVASILGLRQVSAFEGQAAMALEFAAEAAGPKHEGTSYAFAVMEPASGGSTFTIDWAPVIEAILDDVRRGVPAPAVASRFHNGLVDTVVQVARRVGEEQVVLTGGCFQNRLLTERAVARLRSAGLQPYWHRRIPPNDGGIALGQVCQAARILGAR